MQANGIGLLVGTGEHALCLEITNYLLKKSRFFGEPAMLKIIWKRYERYTTPSSF